MRCRRWSDTSWPTGDARAWNWAATASQEMVGERWRWISGAVGREATVTGCRCGGPWGVDDVTDGGCVNPPALGADPVGAGASGAIPVAAAAPLKRAAPSS